MAMLYVPPGCYGIIKRDHLFTALCTFNLKDNIGLVGSNDDKSILLRVTEYEDINSIITLCESIKPSEVTIYASDHDHNIVTMLRKSFPTAEVKTNDNIILTRSLDDKNLQLVRHPLEMSFTNIRMINAPFVKDKLIPLNVCGTFAMGPVPVQYLMVSPEVLKFEKFNSFIKIYKQLLKEGLDNIHIALGIDLHLNK